MKRLLNVYLLLTLLVSLTCTAAYADNRFYINDLNLEPESYATLRFSLDNSDEFYGFQTNIDFPEGVTVQSTNGNLDITLSDRAAGRGYQVISRRLSTGHLRCGAISTKHEAFTGNEGVLVEMKVYVEEYFRGGSIELTDIRFINENDQDVILPNSRATVGVSPISIQLDEIELNLVKIEGLETDPVTLTASFDPDYETTDRTVAWTSSNPTVATVSDKGVVQAKTAGTTSITASTPNGKTAECNVIVRCVRLDKTSHTMRAGNEFTLTATVEPDEVADKTVEWSSSDTNVATVVDGKVTAIGVGEAIITANNGEAYAVCTVTVDPTPAERITLNQNTVDLRVEQSVELTYTVYPETTTNKNVIWTSGNTEVATVDDTGKVTAIAYGIGDAVITATAEDGSGVTAACTVKVVPTPAASITITPNSTELAVGRTVSLATKVLPETTTDKSVSWTSSDESVATVDTDGKVTAIGLGDAIISATANDGSHVTGTCTVTVVPIMAESVTLSQTTAELNVGETLTLEATVLPEDATNKTISWSSSDETVATVDAEGTVTAMGRGTAAITASCGSVKATCTVTVIVPATGINISQSELTLRKGESQTLTATVEPDNANDKTVTWSSDKPEIATVDANGKVTAVALGEATITARTSNGKTAACTVSVVPTPAESISLSQTTAELMVGGTVSLTATVHPDDTTDKSVTWSSDKPEIATVDASGKVTAVALGEATITAKTSNGKTATCAVTVVPTPAESITLSETTAQLMVGGTVSLTATVLPDDTTDKTVTWSSDKPEIATVDADGKVTAVALGTAIITVSTPNGKTATCTVSVVPTPAESITLSQTTAQLMVGGTVSLTATVLPDDTTDKTVTWTSSDESVATVDANGKVTAVALGEATITAKTSNGKTATCTVTVVPTPAESITLSQTTSQLMVGGTISLTATVLPDDATDKTVTWVSDKPEIATVDANGKITAVALGEATITATTSNGKTATCTVTVIPTPAESISLSRTTAELMVGGTVSLTATVLPDDTTDKTVTWSSSDGFVATVDANGKVTAVALGTAIITVSTSNGKTATCTVSVVPTPAESITLSQTTTQLMVGGTVSLTATVLPDDTTDKTVTWSSDKPEIATVDANGKVTAVALGEATITAKTSNGKTATCTVTVIPTPAESITLSQTTAQLMVGGTVSLTATVLPDDTTDKTVTWISSDGSVATVDGFGNINAVALGKAVIVATCGTAIAKCNVDVVPTPAASVTLSQESADLKVGESVTLTASVHPDDTTDKTVTWSSDKPEIATVDAYGKVTAVALGKVSVTASCGNASATCTVNVIPTPVEAITLTNTNLVLKVGKATDLNAIVSPADATDKSVTWTSSDIAVATVDSEGNVTAVAPGSAVITAASVSDPTVTAQCNVTVEEEIIAVTGISLSNTELLMREGYTAELTAIVSPADATDRTVTWTSADEQTATVNSNGLVTAVKAGVTTITASASNGTKATCTVTVVPVVIAVEGITLDKTSLEMTEGDTATLSAFVTPDAATDRTVTWKSSDKAVATVDADGIVTAVGAGSATIYASSSNGLTAECTVTVKAKEILATGISLTNTELLMREGYTAELIAIVRPDNATDKSVTWSSSDESVATVDQKGTVTAIKPGTAVITATTSNGIPATCSVTVVPVVIAVEGITLDKTSVEMTEGDTATLSASVTPDDATDKTVTWKSSDKAVATVDADGIVTAVGAGTATIYASTSNGLTAECTVTVNAKEILATGISLTNTELLMRKGYTTELIAIVSPDNATDKSVTWVSDNEKVATVDQKGTVTAIKPGIAVITATTSNGISASCSVTVIPVVIAVEGITLDKTSVEMKEGETARLKATVTPVDATDKTVTWKSSDRGVATVDADGIVTATGGGTATIYASSSNGLTAECRVTVTVPVTGIILTNSEMTLLKGHTHDLAAIIQPADASDQNVVWSSSDEAIVKVDQEGNVTGVEVGNAIVSATSANGIHADCQVTVVEELVAVLGISLSESEITMEVDETHTLTATLTPENATDPTVTWRSSDLSVATVTQDGVVTAIGGGTAVIYASAHNGRTAECTVTVKAKEVAPTGISLTNTELLMREGYTAELIAIVRPDNATDKTVTWASDNEEVATVDQYGIVTAIAPGTAVITATTSNGISASCTVTVVPVVIAVKGITLDKASLEMTEGDTATLSASVTPDDATDKTVTWKSSDKAVATVDADGEVTAVGAGTATIYASSSNGLTAECTVTVKTKEIAPTGISLTNTELLMREGYTAELIAIVRPDNATDKTVTWSSSDESVATVDQNGIVTAIAPGTAVITATTSNGISASCTVTVVPVFIAVEGITLDNTSLEMTEGDTATLSASVTPDDATDRTVTWKSSDRSVATVDADGIVTAVGAGSAIIYASSSNGLTAECAVTVKAKEIAPTGISLTNTELLMREGRAAELIAIVRPDNATDKSVTWASDNEEVATVDQKGIVTAIKPGTAVITATTSNGISESCTVTVVPVVIAVTSIEISETEIELLEGETMPLYATVSPYDATDKTVTWKSSDKAVATVDADGIVTAAAPGTAIIYASSSNGLTVTCSVTVMERPMTPTQLLRKGNGTTCTFVAMMELDDEQLAALGYNYGFGYTAPSGERTIIAETPLRYCQTTPEIYNDPANDFWVFSYVVDGEGNASISRLRHLDGREEICTDIAVGGDSTKGSGVSMVLSGDCMTLTPSGLLIRLDGTGHASIGVHTTDGIPVYSRICKGGAPGVESIDLSWLQPGSYIVTVRSEGKEISKKFILR